MKSQTRASGSRATVIQRGVASRKSEQPDHVPTDAPSPSKATKEQELSQSPTPPVPNSGKDPTTSLRGTTQVVGVRGADGSPSSGEVLAQSDHKVQAVAPFFLSTATIVQQPFRSRTNTQVGHTTTAIGSVHTVLLLLRHAPTFVSYNGRSAIGGFRAESPAYCNGSAR